MIVKIGNKFIGENQPVFIIAEAGVNHNGSLTMAKKLVDAAKYSGVDAVKFQTFKARDLVAKGVAMAPYAKKNTGDRENQFQMLKKLELSLKYFKELKDYCDQKKILFLSTPHSDVVDFLDPLMPVFKIGSGDLTNIPLLQKVAKKKKPLIIHRAHSNLLAVYL